MKDYSKYECILVEKEGKILTLTINRPAQYNAVDAQLHKELSKIFRDIRDENDVNVIVLTGAGKAFSAGGDLGLIQDFHCNKEAIQKIALEEAKKIIYDLLELDKPIIAKVNGPAIGLGATLALFCDIIIASENATIGDPHVKVGVVAGDGGCVIWPLLVGMCKAKEMLLTGELLKAKEAERIGLINKAVPAENLDKTVDELAQKLADGATQAINYTKIVMNKHLKFFTDLVLDLSLALEGHTFHSDDVKEAVDAMLEKRKPVFRGC
ncbi:enoyl-CoA hydratase/isomerase family protein [Thermodesulfobacteriota bacterium]